MQSLKGRDLISINDLSRPEIEAILAQAAEFEWAVKGQRRLTHLGGAVLATMFYEPSTRTRLSFESAMHRLGGDVISVAEARTSSSAAKGETIADAVRVIEHYADVIVQRHPALGSAQEAAQAASVPILNAGDGAGEHPTQALLDLYTIQQERGTLDGLTITLAGDLKHGRTVHSLSQALTHWGVSLILAAPPPLAMPAELTARLRDGGLTVHETDNLAKAMAQSDLAYMTRLQKERFDDPTEYERLKGRFVIDRALIESTRPDVTIMHPLPRVNEIATDVDSLPNAAYFRQAGNGVYTRMALLALVLGKGG
jgi:aspartate carbamoyltransferase